VSIISLILAVIPVFCENKHDFVSIRKISPPTETYLPIGTEVEFIVVVSYCLSNASTGTMIMDVFNANNESIMSPLSVMVSQGNGTVYFTKSIELPDTPHLTILIYLLPLNTEPASAITSISYELTGRYLSNWYVGLAVIEAILGFIFLAFYYLTMRGKKSSMKGLNGLLVEGHGEGKLLMEFFTILTGAVGGFIFLLMWERLLTKNWPPFIILTLVFFLLSDDWYGSYRRYSKLPYRLGHFILDIAELFTFLLMMYTTVVETTLIATAMYLYAIHGLLWDIHYMRKIRSNTPEWIDLESSLHYALLLILTFSGIQFYFGWAQMFTLRWEAVVFTVIGWLACRIFLLFHQRERRKPKKVVKERRRIRVIKERTRPRKTERSGEERSTRDE